MQNRNTQSRQDILNRRVRIRFLDPDGLGECLTTKEYVSGKIEAVLQIAKRENWVLSLDRLIGWPDSAGHRHRTRVFLLQPDLFIDEPTKIAKYPEAGAAERVVPVQVFACPEARALERIENHDECIHVTGGYMIIEAGTIV